MKIVVLVKAVPDTYGERRLNLETGLVDRAGGDTVLDEICERAIEAALTIAAANGGAGPAGAAGVSGAAEVALVAVGPETAVASVSKGLAMGADSALGVTDPALVGADAALTAEALAAAARRTGFDLIIAGNLSTDGTGGVMAAMLAELLQVPAATNLTTIEVADGAVAGVRATDGGTMRIAAALPAVASITAALPDPRMPGFKGIRAAKKKPLEQLSLADLGVDPEELTRPHAIIVSVAPKPPRGAGVKIDDAGDAADQLFAYLEREHLLPEAS